MARASKGGETGMNGERYEGGQFLPNTTLPKGTPKAQSSAATKKQEIAPYTWEVAPNGERSIYRLVAGSFAQWDVRGVSLKPYQPYIEVMTNKGVDCSYYLNLIDRWNNGERWV